MIAAAWVHDYAPPIRGLVLATPAFRVKLYVPGAVRSVAYPGEASRLRFRQELRQGEPVDARSRRRPNGTRSDALIFRQIAVNMLLDLHDTSTAPRGRRRRHSHADVDARRRSRLGREAGRTTAVLRRALVARQGDARLPGFFHAIFHERDRQGPIGKMREFIAGAIRQRSRDSFAAERGFARVHEARTRPLRADGGLVYAARLQPVKWAMKHDRAFERRHAPRMADRLRLRADARLRLRGSAAGHHAARPPDRSRLPLERRLARNPAAAFQPRTHAATPLSRACTHAAGRRTCWTSRPVPAATLSRRCVRCPPP